jgi:hypothetical protein
MTMSDSAWHNGDPALAALLLGDDGDSERFDWCSYDRPVVGAIQGAKTFPEPITVDPTT